MTATQRILSGPLPLALMLLSYFTAQAACHLELQSYVFDKDSATLSRCPKASTEFSAKRFTLLRITPESAAEPTELEYDVLEDDADDGDAHAGTDSNLRLEELSESQVAQLIESGALQLVRYEQHKKVASDTVNADDDEDERTSKKRPWRKIKRILRRQLIKKPKRAFKKFAHKIGIRRQLRSAWSILPLQSAYEGSEHPADVQEVGILMQGKPATDDC